MSGGRLQEARKFISNPSLKQLGAKCMLSLSQILREQTHDCCKVREEDSEDRKTKKTGVSSQSLQSCVEKLFTLSSPLHNRCREFHHFML